MSTIPFYQLKFTDDTLYLQHPWALSTIIENFNKKNPTVVDLVTLETTNIVTIVIGIIIVRVYPHESIYKKKKKNPVQLTLLS